MRPFRGRFFRPRGIFEEGRISRFGGDLWGLCGLARPHTRARTSREFGPFPAFPLFLMESCLTFSRVRGIVWYLFGALCEVHRAAGGLSRDRR